MASSKIADDPISVAEAWERIREAAGRVLSSSASPAAAAAAAVDDNAAAASVEALCTRVAAADVRSPSAIPKAAVSIKDGFAVRSADAGLPSTRHIATGSVPAGTAPDAMPSLQAGQCAAIATGAVLPPGADAVVMIEDVEVDAAGQTIQIREGRQWPSKPGHDVRSPGSDLEVDKLLVEQGSVLHPADVALLAMAGVEPKAVPVVPRLPVFVLSTGDELLDASAPGFSDAFHAVHTVGDCNRPLILSTLATQGSFLLPLDLGIARDDSSSLLAGLDAISRHYASRNLRLSEHPFALVVSGGVSMGERDIVAESIASWAAGLTQEPEAFHLAFTRIHMKPGKPLTFGFSEHPSLRFCSFCLPGNPVSSAVCLHRFVLPALRIACGIPERHALPQRIPVTLAHDVALDKSRPELARAGVAVSEGGQLSAALTGVQRSSRLVSLCGATALVELPSGKFHGGATIRRGSRLTALLFSCQSAFLCPVARGEAGEAIGIPECFACDPKVDRPAEGSAGKAAAAGAGANSGAIVGAITVSDRAFRGQYEDKSGPAMAAALRRWLGADITLLSKIVPDEREQIAAALAEMVKSQGAALVVTSGGTGPAPRDITPEVTREVCHKELPGFGELMRSVSLAQGVKTAILSRAIAGLSGSALIVNLPGKPQAIDTCLDAVMPAVPHAVKLAGGPQLALLRDGGGRGAAQEQQQQQQGTETDAAFHGCGCSH